jgi:long-chain acyl-CoA synthetase
MPPPQTIVDCFWERLEKDAGKPAIWAYWYRTGHGAISWRRIAEDAFLGAAALHHYGIRPGDRVAQFAENGYEWLVADLSILLSGAVHVPVHAMLPERSVFQQVQDSGAKVLICYGNSPPNVEPILDRYFGGSIKTGEDQPRIPAAHRWLPEIDATRARLEGLRARIRPDDPATLLYTSGTGGEPRGVVLSHGNLYSNAAAIIKVFSPRQDRRLNFLPLSHIFARTCDWYVALVSGTEIGLATSRETILADCQKFQPTVLNGVPYFFDKVRKTLLERNPNPSAEDLQQMLGGKVTLCNVGGAALPDHVFDFYNERGIAMRQGYGLTEASPVVTLSTETSFCRGSVGKPIPGVELKVADDGEILTRGPSVMLGYWNDQAATSEAIDQHGWLHTGDLGRVDDDGFLFVTGRRKELIALASGKKVPVAKVESLLTADPLILQAFVVGEGRNYLTALLVPNPDVIKSEIKRHRLWVFSRRGALSHRRVLEWFNAAVQRTLANLAPWEQVKKFKLLDRGFTFESGELTPKLSLRRDEIERNFAREIDELYQP